MPRVYITVLLIFLIIPCSAFAQRKGNKGRDTLYVRGFDEKLSVRAFVGIDMIEMNYQPSEGKETSFQTNNPPKLGLGISVYNTIIDFSYGYGFRFMSDRDNGKTKALDFSIHHYNRKFVADLFIQRYKGFYSEEPELLLCPDLEVRFYGLHGDYIFNHRKFSYRAAYSQNERQVKSAGSLLVGGGAYITRIKSDSSLVIGGRSDFRTFQAGLSTGYTHTWIIKKNWFVNISATFGINFGEVISETGKRKNRVAPTLLPRAAAGYNGRTWSVGFYYVGNVTAPAISDELTITNHSASFRVSFVKRFGK